MTIAVTMRLPPGLEPLAELALDLRWTWNHATDRLWETLDAEAWARTHNPWLILQTASQKRLDELAHDAPFRAQLDTALADRKAYLEQPAALGDAASPAPLVAYFCMEYGLAEALPLYSGGMGILAGDTLKTASDLGLPMVAVGLLYQQGYARQMIDADGAQQEFYPANAPSDLPIAPALRADGGWLTTQLQFPGRSVTLRVWRAQVGRVPLLLLDSNHPLNGAADRGITNTLYPDAPEVRFMQEIALGVGGWRALRALGYRPDVCHLNEGHAALATLERARSFMFDEHVDFEQALCATRAGNVFTTHTSVSAAFDQFPMDLVRKYGRVYAASMGVDEAWLAALGQPLAGTAEDAFRMANLAMRSCATVNGVSRTHGDVSRQLFQHLFPRHPADDVPVTHVTNGVHVPSWDSIDADRLWTETCGKDRWRGDVVSVSCAMRDVDDRRLWSLAGTQRQALVRGVRERLQRQLGQRGAAADVVDAASHVLDPNALTIGFARRFTAYKRPNLLLQDPERLVRLLKDAQRPVQLIIAGKAHPQDTEGKRLIRAWTTFAQQPQLRSSVVFLDDYDIDLAQQLVLGVDVWINTPRRPWEACGTSGMKVLVNGGLNLSVVDGWWAEAYQPGLGWAIEGTGDDASGTDAVEAGQLYRVLENDIVPAFYARDAEGIPRQWVAAMRESLATLTPRFSSTRMLREYVERLYRPAADACRQRCAEQGRLARDLIAWQRELAAGWHEIRFGALDVAQTDDGWQFNVQVYLGDIDANAVAVELYANPAAAGGQRVWPLQRGMPIEGALNAWCYQARVATPRPAADFTPRVRPHHPAAFVPIENSLIRWWPN